MYSLGQIIREANDTYLAYLSKKTGFLLRGDALSGVEALHSFMRNQLRDFEFKNLSGKQREALDQLFLCHGYIEASQCSAELHDLESKLSWVIQSPTGGLMIPVEMLKGFMSAEARLPQRYLFNIIYRLKGRELVDLASFLQKRGAQLAAPQENPLDLSLAIYLYFVDIHKGLQKKSLQLSMQLRKGPLSSAEVADGTQLLWNYLEKFEDIDSKSLEKVRMHMYHSGRGFYRSLELAISEQTILGQLFSLGLVFPIPTGSNAKNYRVVTPPEAIPFFNRKVYLH